MQVPTMFDLAYTLRTLRKTIAPSPEVQAATQKLEKHICAIIRTMQLNEVRRVNDQ